jgi:hypothetical protein
MKSRGMTIAYLILLLAGQSASQGTIQSSAFPRDLSVVKISPATLALSPGNDGILFQSDASAQIDIAADRVVFAGRSTLPDWSLEISQCADSVRVSKWRRIEVHRYPGGRFWAMSLLEPAGRSCALRFRIRDAGLKSAATILFFSIEFVAAQASVERPSSEPRTSAPVSDDTIPAPSLVTRAEWGASPPAGVMVTHVPYRGAIHHTAMNRVSTLDDGKVEMKFMQDLHMLGNGWKDIGYHYCIDDSGRIYQGTEVQFVASHTDNNNTGNVGVSFMGDFSFEAPTQNALAACAQLMAYLETRYPIRTDSIFGHRDFVPSTLCPGNALYALLADLRNSVRQKVALGYPYVRNPQPLPFSVTALPSSAVSFSLRDDEEGINVDSLGVAINKSRVTPVVQVVDPYEINVTYIPASPFEYSSLITVDITAQDRALPPHELAYHYEFRVKAQTIYIEMTSEDALANATLTKTGTWAMSPDDVVMPDLTDGVVIYAHDSTQEHSVVLHPYVKESGNYVVLLAIPRQDLGLNARYVVENSSGARKEEFVEYNRNFEKAWYPLGTNSVYFASGTPSSGSIELRPMPGFTTSMMLDAIRLEKQNDALPPDAPELKSVRVTPQGKVEIQWYPALQGGLAGYRVIESMDGAQWRDTIANESTVGPGDTSFTFSPPAGKGILYLRIVAVDTQSTINLEGNVDRVLSDPSDTYGACYGMTNTILLVDNFDRVGSWPQKQHAFIRNFGDAIGSRWIGWEVAVNDAIESGDIRLEDYPIVIYMCGDDSDRDESVSNIELLRLQKYLQDGGYLFISGSEIGYDLARPGRPDIALYNAILKSAYVGDDSGVRSCVGVAGGPFDGVTFDFGAVTADTYVEEFPDYIAAINGGEASLYYQSTTRVAAVTFAGYYGSTAVKPARLVYFAFPFETIYPQQSRSDVMKQVLVYFDVAVGVDLAAESRMPFQFALRQNYPNPFNPKTSISYAIAGSKEYGVGTMETKLVVYDLLGREVAVLVNERKAPGRYEVKFDAAGLATGVYFYRLTAGQYVECRKMILMK